MDWNDVKEHNLHQPRFAEDKLVYIKPMSCEDLRSWLPDAPQFEPGTKLFALHNAGGFPLVITDSREAALASAWQHDLETVSLH